MKQLPQKVVVFLSMATKNIIKSLIVSTLLVFLILIAGRVYSESLEISGNASPSNNSVQLNQTDSSTVNQSNSSNVNNSVNANSNTGGNSIQSGVGSGSIKTGDSSSSVNINNQFNNNVGSINCKNCPTPTPTQKPSPSPTDPPGASTNTPTPSAPSGNGGNGGGGAGGGNAAADPGQTPTVLGLSSTSGDKSLLQIIPGFLSIAFGYSLLKRRV